MNETIIKRELSNGETDYNRAKVRLLNHSNVRDWITLILGALIILIGLILFLLNQKNAYYYIALMLVGVFILTGKKPKIEEIFNQEK
jgi:uncharacterized membrane protein YiaA